MDFSGDIIDFNIHLPETPTLQADTNLSGLDLHSRSRALKQRASALGVAATNVMILDTSAVRADTDVIGPITAVGHTVTVALDPRRTDVFEQLERAKSLGAMGVKFHPYSLNLADHDFPRAVAVARHAAGRDMWVVVCCSYGTIRVRSVSAVRLLADLAMAEIDGPVVALHAGGAAVLDVMSIGADMPNLFFDTSFSIPYWIGSSVETDLVFACRKLGMSRWMYGSDHPYVDMEESLVAFGDFIRRHQFTDRECAQILGGTARKYFLGR